MHTLPDIRVATGRHAGAALPASGPASGAASGAEVVLGVDPGCDLVLSDPGLAPRHARLRAAPGGVVVAAIEGPVEAVGLGTIEPGLEALLAHGVEIEAAGVRLALGAPAAARPKPRRRPPLAAALAAALALLPGQLAGLGGAPGAWSPEITRSEPAEADRAAAPEPAAAPVAMEALRARLAAEELDGLALSLEGGAVAVEGRVPQADAERLAGVLAWLDREHPDTVLLTEALDVGGPPPPPVEPPAIQSVWALGAEPWLVVEGAPLRVGEIAPGGWALEAIDAGHAVFEHDGRRWRVHYGAEPSGG